MTNETSATDWGALSARIAGLLRSSGVFFDSIATQKTDEHGMLRNILLPEARAIYKEVKSYFERYAASLAPVVSACLKTFIESNVADFDVSQIRSGIDQNLGPLQYCITALSSLDAQMNYFLTDYQQQLWTRTERALVHLQWSVIADLAYRKRWINAFDEGEAACEKMGAVHLLLHGIWAFKVSAEGQRTDLVLGNLITNADDALRTTSGLVLTEWKKAPSVDQARKKYLEGTKQAKLYSAGALAGVELAQIRYVVVVSRQRIPQIDSTQENGVRYQFKNIVVDPEVPSKEGRKA